MKKFFLILFLFCSLAQAVEDPRYCGTPKRDASGLIIRSPAEVSRFKSIHPCPANGSKTGACPNWAVDHVIPLACGGCDSLSNMQWLPNPIKSSAGIYSKDRFERKIYAHDPPFEGTGSCSNTLVK